MMNFPMSNLFCSWYGLHLFMTVDDERENKSQTRFQIRTCDFSWYGCHPRPMPKLLFVFENIKVKVAFQLAFKSGMVQTTTLRGNQLKTDPSNKHRIASCQSAT